MVLDGVPNHGEIHVVILMDHQIPHVDHRRPGKIRQPGSRFIRDPAGRLAHDFQAPDNGVLALGVAKEFFFGFCGDVSGSQFSCFQDVQQTGNVTRHREPVPNPIWPFDGCNSGCFPGLAGLPSLLGDQIFL